MGFKLKGKPYDEDNMNIAVYRKNLDDGSAAKSNHTGIILQTGLSPEVEGAAIEHEKVHQRQQKRGDLDYDENNFYWKGKTYPRKNLNEHNAKLPWEVEAYKESNKILNGKQTNKQMKEKFQLRNGKGNGASFANLTSKGLMGASLDTDPLKQKAKESAVAGDWQSDPNVKGGEFRVIKGTASETTKKPGTVLKERGTITNKYKGSDNEYLKGLVGRGDYSNVTPDEMVSKGLIDKKYLGYWKEKGYKPQTSTRTETYSNIEKRKKIVPEKVTPKKEIEPVFKTKKEIKEHVFNQYGGISRDRLSLYKKASTGKRLPASFNSGKGDIFGKVATAIAGQKQVFKSDVEKKVKASYDEQNKRRKAKKYADRKGLTWLGSGESLADLRKQNKISQHGNKQKKTKITTGIFSHNRVKKGNKS